MLLRRKKTKAIGSLSLVSERLIFFLAMSDVLSDCVISHQILCLESKITFFNNIFLILVLKMYCPIPEESASPTRSEESSFLLRVGTTIFGCSQSQPLDAARSCG